MSHLARLAAGPLALLLALNAEGAAQATDTGTTRSVGTGVYSAAQARAGQAVFERICAQCHVQVQFSDSNFRRAWTGRSARELFELIRTQMPQDNPGSLRRDEYAAVLAYIFKLNGFPAGDSTLAASDAALRKVRIEASPSPSSP